MIRGEWAEKLRFAASAALPDLIDVKAQITGTLEGNLGKITNNDVDTLARVGLPQIKGWLYPSIERSSTDAHRCIEAFVLGTHDTGQNPLTSEPGPPQHFFIASLLSGNVLKVSDAYDGYTEYVNASISGFVETAWRFYHLKSVLFAMQHSGTDDVPFAFHDEEDAIKSAAWQTLLAVDPTLGADEKETFWWNAVWNYL